jgi:hypothetical protein
VDYNQYLCISMLNRLPTTGKGSDAWQRFKEKMLTKDSLTPAIIQAKGHEVFEMIEQQKSHRPDVTTL